jgi:recombination protein RecA
VIRAQEAGEPVLWIQPESGTLYPPDLAASGVDLDALVVIHVPPLRGALGIVRAAELVLRSGAFGLVVGDVTAGVPRGDAWQSRLAALARQHASRVVLLSDSSVGEASLGPMVSMRIEPIRERRAPGRFVVTYRLLKDKTGGTTAPSPDLRRAPCGLP